MLQSFPYSCNMQCHVHVLKGEIQLSTHKYKTILYTSNYILIKQILSLTPLYLLPMQR